MKSVETMREREKIRAFMRFSGPRMIFHHSAAEIRHMI